MKFASAERKVQDQIADEIFGEDTTWLAEEMRAAERRDRIDALWFAAMFGLGALAGFAASLCGVL